MSMTIIGGARPAFAASFQYLCRGVSDSSCTSAGYTDHGYATNKSKQCWHEYAGINCTNYVAYVESTVNGAPAPSPSNLGSAYQWAAKAKADGLTVNSVASAGATPQWYKNTGMGGVNGHVAYVESVNTSTGAITISEDNAPNGEFSWAVISPGSQYWPDNFIHFSGSPPPPSGGVGFNSVYLGAQLAPDETMYGNDYLMSADTRFVFILQDDGNLVEYAPPDYTPLWSSGTGGSGGSHLVLQDDNNMVLYTASNVPVWASNTQNSGANQLLIQNDGNVVLYQTGGGGAKWATGTGGYSAGPGYAGNDELTTDGSLAPNTYLQSGDGRFTLVSQGDGDLLLNGPGSHLMWKSAVPAPAGATPTELILGNDGT